MCMRHFFRASFLLIFCLRPASAGAEGHPLCVPLSSIKEVKAFNCMDNHFYGQAGLDCLHALEAAIQSRAKVAMLQLAASNVQHVDRAGNAQTHDFQGANSDYEISQNALAELIAAAKAARSSVHQYKENIYYQIGRAHV